MTYHLFPKQPGRTSARQLSAAVDARSAPVPLNVLRPGFFSPLWPVAPFVREAIEYAVEATIDELQDFFVSLGMPRALSEFGVTEDDIEKMIPGLKINRGELFGSFRKLTLDNARKIYRSAL